MSVARAVVIYESLTGNTARAARLVAEEVAAQGVDVSVYPITDIGLKELAEADIVFVGTWVDGLVLFGHRPGRAGRIKAMPVVDGKRVAAFMTYAIHAGKALDRFAQVLNERGATVVSRTLCAGTTRGGHGEVVSSSLDGRRGVRSLPSGALAPPHDWGSLPCVLGPAARSSWALALVARLVPRWRGIHAGGDDSGPPRPHPRRHRVPGCPRIWVTGAATAATTDAADLSGRPHPAPLWSRTRRPPRRCRPAAVRVGVTKPDRSTAPCWSPMRCGELDAENLRGRDRRHVGTDAYGAMAAGEVDAVVGGIDGTVLRRASTTGSAPGSCWAGRCARAPSDLDLAAGRTVDPDRGLISATENWDNLEGQTILVPGGPGAPHLPDHTSSASTRSAANAVDIVPVPPAQAAEARHWRP